MAAPKQTKKIQLDLSRIDKIYHERVKKEVGISVVDGILRATADGFSPVSGRGEFKKLSEAYANDEKKGDRLLLRSEDLLNGRLIEQEVDMAVLSVGLEPRDDAKKLAGMLGISVDAEGWFREANAVDDPVDTFSGGIRIAGTCQGPKDIPDSVAQGSAAAAKVLASIMKSTVKKDMKELSLLDIQSIANKISQS